MAWLDFCFSKFVVLALIFVCLFFPPFFLAGFNRLDLTFLVIIVWFGYWTARAMRNWKTYASAQKHDYFKRIIILASIVLFVLLMFGGDVYLDRQWSTDKIKLLGNNAKGYELHTLEVYPYTAFHPRANCRVKGPMPIEANKEYDDFDVRSGDYGFFIDFHLDAPEPKKKNEFRIILTGGSTAQGFGGKTNDDMFYRLLEKKLTREFAGEGLTVRVINLALANSSSYQNFVVLNKWGHKLDPDLIVSFSGFNDVVHPLHMGATDLPYRYDGVMGLTRATWITESPKLLDDSAKYFPALRSSLFGVAVRTLNAQELGKKAEKEYVNAKPDLDMRDDAKVHKAILDMYVHAFKSIGRDFAERKIPIVIAFQPHYCNPEDKAGMANYPKHVAAYNYLVEKTPPELKGYLGNDWHFLDVQKHFAERNLLDGQHINKIVHLLNDGHTAVADFLTEELKPIITKMRAKR